MIIYKFTVSCKNYERPCNDKIQNFTTNFFSTRYQVHKCTQNYFFTFFLSSSTSSLNLSIDWCVYAYWMISSQCHAHLRFYDEMFRFDSLGIIACLCRLDASHAWLPGLAAAYIFWIFP